MLLGCRMSSVSPERLCSLVAECRLCRRSDFFAWMHNVVGVVGTTLLLGCRMSSVSSERLCCLFAECRRCRRSDSVAWLQNVVCVVRTTVLLGCRMSSVSSERLCCLVAECRLCRRTTCRGTPTGFESFKIHFSTARSVTWVAGYVYKSAFLPSLVNCSCQQYPRDICYGQLKLKYLITTDPKKNDQISHPKSPKVYLCFL